MKKLVFYFLTASTLFSACVADDDDLPTPQKGIVVTTNKPEPLDDITYRLSGTITGTDLNSVSTRGFIVSTYPNAPELPSPIAGDTTRTVYIFAKSNYNFSLNQTFHLGVKYYVRAYANLKGETHYGEEYIVAPGAAPANCNVVNVTGGISAPTTWTAGNVYLVKGSLPITSTLTIEPGVVVKLQGNDVNGSFDIRNGGRVIANGTPANRIVFTSIYDDSFCGDSNGDGAATSPNKGDWNDIEMDGGNNNSFTYCDFFYGGSYNGYVVYVGISSTSFTFDHCRFAHTKNSASDYAAFHGGGYMIDAGESQLTNCVFYDNDRPLYCNSYYTVDASNSFHNPSDPSQTNKHNGIFMWHASNPAGATVSYNVTEVPYVMTSQFTGGGSAATGTINFAPGAIMKFLSPGLGIARAAGRTVNMGAGAILTSYKDDAHGGDTNGDGTASTPATGDWDGFWDYVSSKYISGPYILYAAH
ncbi:MAG TPA: hypothetical protein VL098_06860 [Flavipsychrobacter sp.]|nr:hypothetical protein [Flavipsychrobacter sp.]